MRNPVDRAYSHWWFRLTVRKLEDLRFSEAISCELRDTQPEFFRSDNTGTDLWERNLVDRFNRLRTYIVRGYYAVQINRYRDLFPDNMIKVVFYDDLRNDTNSVVQDICKFIGINYSIVLKDSMLYNTAYDSRFLTLLRIITRIPLQRLVPKSLRLKAIENLAKLNLGGQRPPMDRETRSWLVGHYYSYNRELESIVNRDLSHWDK